MSETTGNAELIAEAKNYGGDNGTSRWPSLITDRAAALEQSEFYMANRRDDDIRATEYVNWLRHQLAGQVATIEAVRTYVEKVRAHGANSIGGGTVYVERLLSILSRTDITERSK